MEEYTSFASVYDHLMEEIPYDEWCEYIIGLLREYGIEDGLVLELGCGTGSITERMAAAGYDMIGVDNSTQMLQLAQEKKEASGYEILYLHQDMREFELYGTVRAVVSLCDTMNYLLEPEELTQVCSLVNNYLDPGGLFLFDMKSPFYYKECVGNDVYVEQEEDLSLIWENYYDDETRINEYALTIFARTADGLYDRTQEVHEQRAYDPEEIKQAVEAGGLTFIAVFADGSSERPSETSRRYYILAREHGKG